MSAPLYFLPHATLDQVAPGGRIDQAQIAARGLVHVFGDCNGIRDDVAAQQLAGRGPDNLPGVILCALPPSKTPPRRLGFYPREQRWQPGFQIDSPPADHPPFFIGIDTAEPPTPADLARPKQFRGHRVELADGQLWEVPVLRAPVGKSADVDGFAGLQWRTNLPQRMRWNAAGQFELAVREQYQAAWDESLDTADFYYNPEGPREIDFEDAALRALRALSLNYRIGPAEQNALELLDTQTWDAALYATVDGPTIKRAVEAEKKSNPSPSPPGSPNSSPGNADSSPATDPPAETSTSPA